MNTNKHDWKKFSRRGLSLMLALVTLVALCIPTGVAVGDDADETANTAYTEVQTAADEETAEVAAETEMEASSSTVDSAEPETLVADESLVDTAEEETLTTKATEPTALEPTAQMASESASSSVSSEDAISTADLYDTNLAATKYTVVVGDTTTISGSSNKSSWCNYGYKWTSSDASVATVENNGSSAVVTGVSAGTVTISHTYCTNKWYHSTHDDEDYKTETFTVTVSKPTSESAAMYYLADPTQDWKDNETSAWRPTGDISKTYKATVTTTGATWFSSKNLYITEDNYSKYISAWPDGSKGYTWTLTRGDATTGSYFTSVLDECWDAYASSVQKALEVDISKSDVSSITITPAKISKNNGTNPDKHLDCTVSFACDKIYVAKFMVMNPETSQYEQKDATYYLKGKDITETTKVEIGSTTTINGKEYVLTGWYNEAGDLVTDWDYTPTDAELEDGMVYFYAHYEPSKTTETVFVYVAGYEWVDGKKALYSDEMLKLLGIDPDTLDANGYFPVGSIEIAKSYFTNKGSATQTAGKALLNDESDWTALLAALGKLDTTVIDDGIFVNNQNNKVAAYLDYAGKDLNHGWGSMYTALFRWHLSGVKYGTSLAHLGYSEKWQATDEYGTNSPVQYHLDLRFSTNHITFMYGNNGIKDSSIYDDGKNAYQGDKEIGSQVYITNSVTAGKDAYSTFDVPEGYAWDGKFYKDADFTTEYSDDEIFSINITKNYNVYLKLEKQNGTLVVNKTFDIQSNWMTDEEKASLDNVTFTATCTSDEAKSFDFALSDMEKSADGTYYTYTKTELPGDSTWTITENGAELKYHTLTAVTSYEGDAEYATVPKGGSTTVGITNTYTDKMVDLVINKTVTGSNTHAGSFTFLATNNRTGVTYTATITTSTTGSYTISNVPAGEYTVKELGNDNYECTSTNPQTQDIAEASAEFSFVNAGNGDSYQYSSAVVNKFEKLLDDLRVVFTKVIPSATK